MAQYLVTWEIEVEADNPVEAAACALITMRDKESCSQFFDVHDDETRIQYTVDLETGEQNIVG